MTRMLGCLGVVVCVAGISCRLFPAEQAEATGAFEAKRASAAALTDTTNRCSVSLRGVLTRNEKIAATWTWTSAFFAPLAALEIDCSLGKEFEDGALLISIPVRESGKPIPIGSYRIVEFGDVPSETDRFAWITLRTRDTPGRHLAGAAGQLEIEYVDSLIVRGHFRATGPLESNK